MLFMTATESDGKADKIKIAMLLASIGPEALDRFNQFSFDVASGEDRESYDQVMLKFENHFNGLKRTVFSRYQFWTYKRAEQQPFVDNLTVVREGHYIYCRCLQTVTLAIGYYNRHIHYIHSGDG